MHRVFLTLFAALIAWRYRLYLSATPLPSVDLHGHITLTEQLLHQILSGRVRFYDPAWFGGWPAFNFYGFLAHLLTGLASLPIGLVSNDPVRMSAHVLMVLGLGLLPFSIYYLAKPLGKELISNSWDKAMTTRCLFVFTVGTLTVWFLNLGDAWYGIGAGTVLHFGLFAQLFAWHLLLVHCGLLVRVVLEPSPRHLIPLALVFTALILTHPLSLVVSLFYAGLCLIYYSHCRGFLAAAHLLGAALAAFWLLPFAALRASYTMSAINPIKHDFWQLLFRYPLDYLIQWPARVLEGNAPMTQPMGAVLIILVVTAFVSPSVRRTRALAPLLMFSLIGAAVLPSNYIQASIPVGLHYQRMMGLVLLITLCLLAATALVFISGSRLLVIRRIGFAVIAVACLLASAAVEDPRHGEVAEVLADPSYLQHERAVLEYFDSETKKGRVFFEWFTDPRRFTRFSQRYLESHLFQETGFETANGLIIQSAPAYRFSTAVAMNLGATVTSGRGFGPGEHSPRRMADYPAILPREMHLPRQEAVERLRELGITHIVLGSKRLLDNITDVLVREPVRIGPYTIAQIAETPHKTVVASHKPVIGYLDRDGSLPFKFLELYFYARRGLASRYELILLEPDKPLPAEVFAVLVNGDKEVVDLLAAPEGHSNKEIIAVKFKHRQDFDYFKPRYRRQLEIDFYEHLRAHLDNVIRVPKRLKEAQERHAASKSSIDNPQLQWASNHQSLKLTGLPPGKLVRLNYNYFPSWASADGHFYRGLAERMWFLPNSKTAQAHYSAFNHWSGWVGTIVTILAAGYCLLLSLGRSINRNGRP